MAPNGVGDAAADRGGTVITGGLSPIGPGTRGGGRGGRRGGLLVVFGVPDRRMDAAGVAAALRAGGVPAREVTVVECHRQGIAAVPGGNRGRAGPVREGVRLGSA